ncbi:MAG: uracil-DNA glycosylase [Candidatus Moranbacteria bacterium]|nr:uracil-DNA glycosylase [Candidatus Moranbacteria bacterium]
MEKRKSNQKKNQPNKQSKLGKLNEEMEQSKSCCHLAGVRTNIVPGEGSAEAKVMFIGEGPGQKEDELGRPFVGQAGQLLNELLAEIGLERRNVFIANVLKCRPPNNRDPLPEEVETCWPWLRKQIEIIDPVVIVPLGRHAMERFLPGMKISQIRGKVMRRNVPKLGVKVFMPTYHPAAVLYHREWLGALREDFRKIPRIIEHLESNLEESVEDGGNGVFEWDSLEIQPVKNRQEQGKLL